LYQIIKERLECCIIVSPQHSPTYTDFTFITPLVFCTMMFFVKIPFTRNSYFVSLRFKVVETRCFSIKFCCKIENIYNL